LFHASGFKRRLLLPGRLIISLAQMFRRFTLQIYLQRLLRESFNKATVPSADACYLLHAFNPDIGLLHSQWPSVILSYALLQERLDEPVRNQDSVPPTYVGSNSGIAGQVRSPNSLLLDATQYENGSWNYVKVAFVEARGVARGQAPKTSLAWPLSISLEISTSKDAFGVRRREAQYGVRITNINSIILKMTSSILIPCHSRCQNPAPSFPTSQSSNLSLPFKHYDLPRDLQSATQRPRHHSPEPR
jgi:hypothetical protein